MKINNKHGEANRSPLTVGATILLSLIIIMLILLATHNQMDSSATKDKESVALCTTQTTIVTGISLTTTSISTKKTTTSTTTTTTTVTTTLMTTTEATTSQTIVVTTNPPEPVTEAPIPEPESYVEPEPQLEPQASNSELSISDYELILLRNVVAREYGSDWVSVPEKAKVVAVVMNRVNSPRFPNTIEGVLTQPYQFSGYYACNYEWSNVTQSVRDAVDYYFTHTDEFGAWTGIWGDGTLNHFY